jgi:hypothetical protein
VPVVRLAAAAIATRSVRRIRFMAARWRVGFRA